MIQQRFLYVQCTDCSCRLFLCRGVVLLPQEVGARDGGQADGAGKEEGVQEAGRGLRGRVVGDEETATVGGGEERQPKVAIL